MGQFPHTRPPRPNDLGDLKRYRRERARENRYWQIHGVLLVLVLASFFVLGLILIVRY